MDKVIIIGAGGYAREILAWIDDINEVSETWEPIGFLDDNPNALDNKNCKCKIIGTIKDHEIRRDVKYVLGIANPSVKEKIACDFESRGAEFASIIHPTAIVHYSAVMGKGVVLYPGAGLGPDTEIGNFVTLLSTGMGHDVRIGDYSTISSLCGITGNVKIGRKVFVGDHACIIPGRKIGDEAFICIGSVVMTNVKPGIKMIGNPAKKMDF